MAPCDWYLVAMVTILTISRSHSSFFDPSVCLPANVSAIDMLPLPTLGDAYSAQIRWASENERRFYDVREDFDLARGQAAVTISMPLLPNNAKMIYDLNTGYISVISDVTQTDCTVDYPDSSFHTYSGYPWLASLNALKKHIEAVKDLKYHGETLYNGINADHYSACLYDYASNMTMFFNLYFVGQLSSFSVDWFLPHVPRTDRSLPYVITLHAKATQGAKVTVYNVTGTVGMFDTNPIFTEDAFLPPPGTWCEGLSLTSLPPLPADFSLLAEIVDLDYSKVTYEHVFFNSKRHMIRKDWKAVETSTSSSDLDPMTSIYDFNIGVKYTIDRHLKSCDRAEPIALGDEFTVPVPGQSALSRQFQMAKSEIYFHRHGAHMHLLGQRKIRSITCDVYVGYYLDAATQRNFTVQWYFSKRHWTIETGDLVESGALMRMELWKDKTSNPVIYNIMEFRTEAPDYDVFDVSLCYSAKEKIHFVMEVRVSDPAQFSSVKPRVLKDTVIEMLGKLIAEDNRFVGIQVDYDGGKVVYVYATLIERSAIDNLDIQHPMQHTMEAAFDFMKGSVKSQIDFLITNTAGQVITITPYDVLRVDFRTDFTTAPPTSSTTTLAPPIPPKLRRSTTTTSHRTTPSQPSTAPTSPYGPIQRCTCPTPVQPQTPINQPCTTAPPCRCSSRPNVSNTSVASWTQCRPVCMANHMCDCSQGLPATRCPSCSSGATCDCVRDCSSSKTHTSGTNCAQSSGKSSSSDTGITIGALIGGLIGTLILGFVLGFIATRVYHLLKVVPQQRLINNDDETKY